MQFKKFAAKVSERLKTIKAGVLVRIDIFEIGYINLIYGFEKGNKVLETVRECLERHIRDVDMFAKTGGDEFTIFIELSKEENAWAIAEKLYRLFIHPIENISVFINAGISIFPIDGNIYRTF